ncbi:MAG: DUF2194 domain-containing protein [Clostridiaceae bacterium]|nr:DUF2194 domain-containing protein [Clostridiaceae bacterium]
MTISKSNFIVISITMLAVLFLFQFSNISARYTSTATTNNNQKKTLQTTQSDAVQAEQLKLPETYSTAIIGSGDSKECSVAEEWCCYVKRSYYCFDSLTQYDKNTSQHNKLLILASGAVATNKDIKILEQTAKEGIHIILTAVPDTALIRSSSLLQKLMGIESVENSSCTVDGVTLLEGFLLGGKAVYDNYRKTIPYFRLHSGTKTYMIANLKDQKKQNIENENLPPVIWRNQYENSFIFTVNWDFCKNHAALGMLTAMYADTCQYYIYPIVDAQTVVCQNYPYLSDENSSEIKKRYYYSSSSLCKNVLWPDLVSILNSTGDKLSGMLAPKLEYKSSEDVYDTSLDYFFKQTEWIQGELGISGDQLESEDQYENKIQYDTDILQTKLPDYHFNVFSPGDMPESVYENYLGKEGNILSDVCTMILPKEQEGKSLISFYNEEIIQLSGTIDGFSHTDEEDIYLRSIETALGYSTVYLDFRRVLYPTDKQDDWTKLSKKLSSYLDTYWSGFRDSFTQTTASEAAEKARSFLALNYTSYRQNNTINLSITNFNREASFILSLTNEEISSVSGGRFTEIEKDRYCITAIEETVAIHIAQSAGTEE